MIPLQQPPELPPAHYSLQSRDAEHIKLLSIFHYVFAGLSVVGGLFFALYLVFAMFMIRSVSTLSATGPSGSGTTAPSGPPAEMIEMMGWAYGAMGVVGGLGSLLVGLGSFMAGKSLAERRRRTFIYVVSAIQCLFIPFGTALGIFTILVLERPTVKGLFDVHAVGGGMR